MILTLMAGLSPLQLHIVMVSYTLLEANENHIQIPLTLSKYTICRTIQVTLHTT